MWPLQVRSHVPLRPSHNLSTPSFAPLRKAKSQTASKQDCAVRLAPHLKNFRLLGTHFMMDTGASCSQTCRMLNDWWYEESQRRGFAAHLSTFSTPGCPRR